MQAVSTARTAALTAAGGLLVLLSTHSFHSYSLDEVYYYGMAVGLAERGRPTVSPCFEEPFLVPYDERAAGVSGAAAGASGAKGECWTQYAPGLPVVLAPFVAAAPEKPPYARVASATLVGPILGAATLYLLALHLGPKRALLLFFGTPLWFYSRTLFSEPLRTLLLLQAFLSPRPLVSGLAAGGAVLTRLDSILFVPFVLWRHRRSLRAFAASSAPVAAGLVLYAAYNSARFGNPLTTGYREAMLGRPFVGVAALLAAPGIGLVWFAPLAFFGIRPPRDSTCFPLYAAAVLSLLFYGSTPFWQKGWNWGPRYLHFTWTALGLLALSGRLEGRRRRLVFAAAGIGFGMNLLAVSADYTLHFERAVATGAGGDATRAVLLHPAWWPPAGQVVSLLEGAWDLPLWTVSTWPLGAFLAGAGLLVLARALRGR